MSLANILKGIGGELEIGRSSDVRPPNAPFDFADCRLRDTVLRGQLALRANRLSNFKNIALSKLAAHAHFPAIACSVRKLVALILNLGRPSEVIEAIVKAIAITVRDLVFGGWRGTHKYQSDNSVDVVVLAPSIDSQPDADIIREPRFWACTRKNTLNAPMCAHRIVGSKRYGLPYFVAIIGVSHSAVLSRGGQGRALLTQRFRPVLCLRKQPINQPLGVA